MLGFGNGKETAGPPARTSLELQHLLAIIEAQQIRIENLEQCVMMISYALRVNFDRVDQNCGVLEENIHRMASMVIRPPKDLLNGHDEVN